MKTTLSKILGVLFVFVMILCVNACTQKTDVQSDVEAIEKLYEELASTGLDVDLHWIDDGVLMQPGTPVIGKEAIRARAHSFEKNWNRKFIHSIEEIVIDDNYAFVRSIARVEITPVNGGDVNYSNWNNQLRILRRQPDGSWKFARAMFDSGIEK